MNRVSEQPLRRKAGDSDREKRDRWIAEYKMVEHKVKRRIANKRRGKEKYSRVVSSQFLRGLSFR